MSQIGMASPPGARENIIGAHADYRSADFFFPRTQSLEMRSMPWEKRLKPARSYSQIASYFTAGVLALSIGAAFFV